jgi:hypothetical protein
VLTNFGRRPGRLSGFRFWPLSRIKLDSNLDSPLAETLFLAKFGFPLMSKKAASLLAAWNLN